MGVCDCRWVPGIGGDDPAFAWLDDDRIRSAPIGGAWWFSTRRSRADLDEALAGRVDVQGVWWGSRE